MGEDQVKPIKIAGVDLVCRHCGFKAFRRLDVQVQVFPWHEEAVDTYACVRCGSVQWFLLTAGTEDNDFAVGDAREPTPCLACGQEVPAGQTKCQACGWTYESQQE